MKSFLASTTLAIALTLLSATAHATLFDGKQVHGEYLFPTGVTTFQNLGTTTVGAQTEFYNIGTTGVNLDLSDTRITADYSHHSWLSTWTATAFNGFHISDVSNSIADFTAVSIDPITNLNGFGQSRISFDADNIWVNWGGLSFDGNTRFALEVTAEPVPEPSTLLLLGAGLLGATFYRRRAGRSA